MNIFETYNIAIKIGNFNSKIENFIYEYIHFQQDKRYYYFISDFNFNYQSKFIKFKIKKKKYLNDNYYSSIFNIYIYLLNKNMAYFIKHGTIPYLFFGVITKKSTPPSEYNFMDDIIYYKLQNILVKILFEYENMFE